MLFRSIVVGINMACLDKRSTITRIESEPEEVGSVSIKSIEIEFHGRSGIGLVSLWFCSHTSSTRLHIFLDEFSEPRPSVFAPNKVDCLVLTQMSGENVIMLIFKNS